MPAIDIYPYQEKLIGEIHRALRRHRSVCLELATGAGKTIIAAEIMRRMMVWQKNHQGPICLFLVHRRELIRQTYLTLKKTGYGDYVGVIAPGQAENPFAQLQIASVQSLVRRLVQKRLSWLRPKLIFVDEAHHVRARTWEQILGSFKSEEVSVLGLTATPARLDGKGLGKYFEQLINGPSISELVSQGYLAPLDCYSIPVGIDLSGLTKRYGDFSKAQLDDRIPAPVIANSVNNILRYARDRKIIYYAVSVPKSREVAQALTAQGIRTAHVDSNMSVIERDAIFRGFSSGKYQGLANVEIATEGLDCPDCDCVGLGRPTASLTLYRQMVGRAMRRKSDGRRGLVLDLAGIIDYLGLPDDPIEWSLEDGIVHQDPNDGAPTQRRCYECGFYLPPGIYVCPNCHAEREGVMPIEADVHLEMVTPPKREEKLEQLKLDWKEANRKAYASFGDQEELERIRREFHQRPGWSERMRKVFSPMWERDNHGPSKRRA